MLVIVKHSQRHAKKEVLNMYAISVVWCGYDGDFARFHYWARLKQVLLLL